MLGHTKRLWKLLVSQQYGVSSAISHCSKPLLVDFNEFSVISFKILSKVKVLFSVPRRYCFLLGSGGHYFPVRDFSVKSFFWNFLNLPRAVSSATLPKGHKRGKTEEYTYAVFELGAAGHCRALPHHCRARTTISLNFAILQNIKWLHGTYRALATSHSHWLSSTVTLLKTFERKEAELLKNGKYGPHFALCHLVKKHCVCGRGGVKHFSFSFCLTRFNIKRHNYNIPVNGFF